MLYAKKEKKMDKYKYLLIMYIQSACCSLWISSFSQPGTLKRHLTAHAGGYIRPPTRVV